MFNTILNLSLTRVVFMYSSLKQSLWLGLCGVAKNIPDVGVLVKSLKCSKSEELFPSQLPTWVGNSLFSFLHSQRIQVAVVSIRKSIYLYLTQGLKAVLAIQLLVFTTVLGAKLTNEKLIE